MNGFANRWIGKGLDWLFPLRCAACRSFLTTGQDVSGLCGACEGLWPRLSDPQCPRCARPFENLKPAEVSANHLCGDCLSEKFHCEKVRAAGRYSGLLHDLIVRLKYRGEEKLARFLGDRMGWDVTETDWDLVLPIPLHRKRLRERGYNQSLLLARRLVRRTGGAVDAFVLKKIRETDVQAGLTREERLQNLKNCFTVSRPEAVYGKKVLLVDDVFTTGSTLETAARALAKAGAQRVEAVVLARAV